MRATVLGVLTILAVAAQAGFVSGFQRAPDFAGGGPWVNLKKWHTKYHDQGLVIVAVHSPEFSYERSEQYVRDSVAKLGIRYAVVMDNNFKIWRAYNNVYWPTVYLVDKQGVIRYRHIGEGAYQETEQMIRALVSERS